MTDLELMASIFDAKNEVDLIENLSTIIKKFEFESFIIGLEFKEYSGQRTYHVAGACPPSWLQRYTEQEYILIDPTVAHCKLVTTPLVWSEKLFADASCMHLLEEARFHGIDHGISISVHDRNGQKTMLSLIRDEKIDEHPTEKNRVLSVANILISCIHVVSNRLITINTEEKTFSKLTKQETECLQWVASGKTSWEIGRIMSISEPTVVFHLKNIMRKLDVSNRSHALAIALRLGLID